MFSRRRRNGVRQIEFQYFTNLVERIIKIHKIQKPIDPIYIELTRAIAMQVMPAAAFPIN